MIVFLIFWIYFYCLFKCILICLAYLNLVLKGALSFYLPFLLHLLIPYPTIYAGAVIEAFVRLHEKGLIYQGITWITVYSYAALLAPDFLYFVGKSCNLRRLHFHLCWMCICSWIKYLCFGTEFIFQSLCRVDTGPTIDGFWFIRPALVLWREKSAHFLSWFNILKEVYIGMITERI